MRIQQKWIEDNAVNGTKLRLSNNQTLRARNAAGSGDVDILKVNTSDKIEFSSLPQASGTASAASDLINLSFLQGYVAGVRDPHDAVRVASTSNITVSSPGSTIDGVTMATNDRVLLAGQSTASENGVYVWNNAATPMTRATDADATAEVTYGFSVVSVEGTSNARMQWVLTTADPITVGSTSLTFVSFPAQTTYSGGDMMTLTGNVFTVDLATSSGLESTNAGNVAGQLRVRQDDAVAVKDRTTKINATNAFTSLKRRKQTFTLSGTDISNGYVDLDQVAHESSIEVRPNGGLLQTEGTDYTPNYTGGASSKTRITFAGDLSSLLAASDVLYVSYEYLP